MNSPNRITDGQLAYKILSEGEEIKDEFGLISFTVRKEINRIGKALLVFEAGDMPKGEISESDKDTFAPGRKISILAGYKPEEIELVFEGIVISHQLKIQSENECRLHIDCRDYAYLTTSVKKDVLFKNKTDNEVISEILSKYSLLSTTVDATQTRHNEVFQRACTDWDFILSRARLNGLTVITDGEKINIKRPELSKKPILKVTYGLDLIEFDGKLSASHQISDVKVQAWDVKSQELKVVEGKLPKLNKQGDSSIAELAASLKSEAETISTIGYADEAELQAIANSRLLESGLSMITGTCKFYGNTKALPGELIELEGLGKRFNGNAFIGSVEHEFDEEGWTTTIGMGLDLQDIISKQGLTIGLPSEIYGLYIGKVVQLDKDPDGEYKILVRIPFLDSSCDTIWARLGNFSASDSYGSFFIPDIGDEVIIGFFNNDSRFPAILGSLYSSKLKPPYEIEAANKIRAFISKSQMRIEFEEEKKMITLSTPDGNKIILSDDAKGITLEDQNSNKIVMDNNGILIDSAKKVTIRSKANIETEAGSNMAMKAKSNISVQGQNVDLKANAALTAKGTAKAEISASGQMIIKGAMVMIN